MLKVTAKDRKLYSAEIADKILKNRKKESSALPSFFEKKYEVTELKKNGFTSYRLVPKRDNFEGKFIVYLYGGGLCHYISQEQWQFIAGVAEKTGSGIFVPMYPIAPENSCKETFEMLEAAYSDFGKSYDVKEMVLLGDGDGGGLALSLAILAWENGFRKPDQLILLSPVLDHEYFDEKLETLVLKNASSSKKVLFNDSMKEFINLYWVKDYAVKTKYTSPFYEDCTDICDDVVMFSGTGDIFNCYARAFYNKAKKQGVNIRFFESNDEDYNYLIYGSSKEKEKAYGYLLDVINKEYKTSMTEIYKLKLMSDWSKRFPEIFKDEKASKFVYDNKFDFSGVKTRISEYDNLLMAAHYVACDKKAKLFIKEFPLGTIVNLGCRLDNMFQRVDNGYINWYTIGSHNSISVRRMIYGENEREKTIGRNIRDFSWMDEIECERKKGILFICNDTIPYMTRAKFKSMLEKLMEKFPAAEFVFTSETGGAVFYRNHFHKNPLLNRGKRFMAIDDTEKMLNSWSIGYKIKSEEPLMKFVKGFTKMNLKTKFNMAYNLVSYNHKITHIRLGEEEYENIGFM